MAVLEPRVRPGTFAETVNRMDCWMEAVRIVSRMEPFIADAHSDLSSAKHVSAQQQHNKTDAEQHNNSAGSHTHHPMFEILSTSIPDRARFHVSSQVLPEERWEKEKRVQDTPHVSRWAVQGVAESAKSISVRPGEPLVATGDESSRKRLNQHVKMFEKLSDTDRLPVTILVSKGGSGPPRHRRHCPLTTVNQQRQ